MSRPDFFYHDKPLFGLDIGSTNLKVLQLEPHKGVQAVTGYGMASFDASAIRDGVVVDIEAIAKAAHTMFDHNIIGSITTRRVAVAIPAVRTFNRNLRLPKLSHKDLDQAVRAEAEQYIPMPLAELYLDYTIIEESEEDVELLLVAAPKRTIDSHFALLEVLGLEAVAIETTLSASARLFAQAEESDIPTILIDFGSISSDITIHHKNMIATATVPGGGAIFTKAIRERLGVSDEEAHIIKTRYGLGVSKKQAEITEALTPTLNQLVKEVRRMIRYYQERSETEVAVQQIITIGGGASMHGLSEFLTNALRLPVRTCNPWQHITFGKLQPPNATEKTVYVTVAGLALLPPAEVFI